MKLISQPASTAKYVAYYRVSTDKQGKSGLGLESQQQSVQNYLGSNPLLASFTEVESGKKNDRPVLQEALKLCRLHKATLIVAKLDRLARNAYFLLGLKEAGVDFIAVDMPSANRMTIGIMAVVAEEERALISQRTKAALAMAKGRGIKLGNPQNLSQEGRVRGRAKALQTQKHKAKTFAADVLPIIQEIQQEGITSHYHIALALNERNIPTVRGGKWQAVQVGRVLQQ